MSRYTDLIVGSVFAVIALIYFGMSFNIQEAGVTQMGPAFVPRVIAGMTFLLSIILIANSVGALKHAEIQPAGAEDRANEEKPHYVPVVLTAVLLLAYVMLLEPMGFIASTIVYLFLQFNISAPKTRKGLKHQGYFLAGAVVATVAINTLFVTGFNVMLPQGIWE